MNKSITLALVFLLTACTTNATTPVSLSARPVATLLPVPSATSAPAAQPTASTIAGDAFEQMGITLPAPACDGNLTPAQTEGPYYTPNTPERNSLLETGTAGTRLIVVGYVLDQDCQPLPGAWLDFWQADASGAYDNQGYTLRGHQFADRQGRYFLETVLPGEYPGRTQHIHVKVQPPKGAILTSQLYFPQARGNAGDGIFDPALLVNLEDRQDYLVAYFDFVVSN